MSELEGPPISSCQDRMEYLRQWAASIEGAESIPEQDIHSVSGRYYHTGGVALIFVRGDAIPTPILPEDRDV